MMKEYYEAPTNRLRINLKEKDEMNFKLLENSNILLRKVTLLRKNEKEIMK